MRPASFAAALVVMTVLAGCSSPAPTSSSNPLQEPQLPASPETTFYHFAGAVPAHAADLAGNNTAFLAAGGYSSIGTSTYEPTIGATKTGSIFMTSLKRELQAVPPDEGTHIIKGTDHGRNWTDVGPFLGPLPVTRTINSNDPFMYVDPTTSRIYDFDMCGTLSGFCVSFSDDDGASWTTVGVATGDSTALDHQSLAAAPPAEGVVTVGYANVLTWCVNRGLTTVGSWCSTSRDGGINWTPLLPGYPAGSDQCSGLSGHVKGSPDGRFYRGNPSGNNCAAATVYRSDDAGVTWTQHVIPNSTSMLHDVEVAVDVTGNLYAFWIAEDGLPYLAVSHDRGDTWGNPMMVAAPGVTATGFPAVTAGADGRVAFAYIGTTLEKGFKGNQQKATWNGYIGVMTDAKADKPLITTVTVNDPVKDPLAKGPCGGTRCGGFGDFIDITIDPEGRPFAAFANDVTGDQGSAGGAGIAGTMEDGPALVGTLAPLSHVAMPGPASLA
jgi:hypothetical protein